jgi:hypothetical protein
MGEKMCLKNAKFFYLCAPHTHHLHVAYFKPTSKIMGAWRPWNYTYFACAPDECQVVRYSFHFHNIWSWKCECNSLFTFVASASPCVLIGYPDELNSETVLAPFHWNGVKWSSQFMTARETGEPRCFGCIYQYSKYRYHKVFDLLPWAQMTSSPSPQHAAIQWMMLRLRFTRTSSGSLVSPFMNDERQLRALFGNEG